MAPGERKTEKISADDAYGQPKKELVAELERGKLPPDIDPKDGMVLRMTRPDGKVIPVTVKNVTSNTVTLDANHPLAGKDLTFEIELVAIV